MATLVRLRVVPNNLDVPGPEAYDEYHWEAIPWELMSAKRSYDEWVVSMGDDLTDPFPDPRVGIAGPAGDFDENHIRMDGGLGPSVGCVK